MDASVSILTTSVKSHGNSCRMSDLAMKVVIVNELKEGDVLRTGNNALHVLSG